MKQYKLLQLPDGIGYDEVSWRLEFASKKQLRSFFDWFISEAPLRISMLSKIALGTSRPSCTPDTLAELGKWYAAAITGCKRSAEELDTVASLAGPLCVSALTFTELDRSFAFDVGLYLGEVFRTSLEEVEWVQPLRRSQRWVDYGQPVLTGFGSVLCNPHQLCRVIASKRLDGADTRHSLGEVYEVWKGRGRVRGGFQPAVSRSVQ